MVVDGCFGSGHSTVSSGNPDNGGVAATQKLENQSVAIR
jgi:hypothetical protein